MPKVKRVGTSKKETIQPRVQVVPAASDSSPQMWRRRSLGKLIGGINRVSQPGLPQAPHPLCLCKQLQRDKLTLTSLPTLWTFNGPSSKASSPRFLCCIPRGPLLVPRRTRALSPSGSDLVLHRARGLRPPALGSTQWDACTNPQLLGHCAAMCPWEEHKEPAERVGTRCSRVSPLLDLCQITLPRPGQGRGLSSGSWGGRVTGLGICWCFLLR